MFHFSFQYVFLEIFEQWLTFPRNQWCFASMLHIQPCQFCCLVMRRSVSQNLLLVVGNFLVRHRWEVWEHAFLGLVWKQTCISTWQPFARNQKCPHQLCHCDHGESADATSGLAGVREPRGIYPPAAPILCCMALTHGHGGGADLEVQCRRHARGKKVTGYAASLARHWLALWITSTGWHSTECFHLCRCVPCLPTSKKTWSDRGKKWDSIATSKMKDGLQSAYEYQPTPNAELEWVGQPTSTRGVVCRLPCEMEGSNYTNTISAAIGAKLIDHANITHPRKKYKRGGGYAPKNVLFTCFFLEFPREKFYTPRNVRGGGLRWMGWTKAVRTPPP